MTDDDDIPMIAGDRSWDGFRPIPKRRVALWVAGLLLLAAAAAWGLVRVLG